MANPKKQSDKHINMHRGIVAVRAEDVLPHGPAISYRSVVKVDAKDCRSSFETINNSSRTQRLIMDASLDAIICMNLSGNITFWNPQAEIIFGWKKEDAIGKKLSSLIIPEQYRKQHDEGIANYVKTGDGPALNKLLELTALKKNGKEFLVELTIMPIKDEAEEVFCAFIRDITEKKLVEKKLKESEARLIEAQEVAKVGSWETDLLTLKVLWSDETYRIFELDPAEFRESHPGFLAFVHPDDLEKVNEAFTRSMEGNTVNTIEHRIITPKGNTRFVAERWKIYHNEQQQPARAIGTCQDITEQKDAEIRKIESEFKYHSLIEQATDAICIADASMKIIEINPSGCQMLGYSEEEFLNLTVADLFVVDDLIATPFKFDELQAGKIISNERRLKRKDGTLIDLELNVKLLQDGRFVLFARDITKRKQADKALNAAYEEKNTILESIGDAFFAVDKNWIVNYWNKEAEIKLHTLKHKILGKHLWDVFADSIDSISYKKYHEAIDTNQVVNFEDHYPPLDKWYEISAYPSAAGLSVYVKDITEHKKAEVALQKAYEEKNTILESIGDAFFAVDKNWIVTYWNKEAEIKLNVPKHKILGKYLWDLFLDCIDSTSYKKYHEALDTNQVANFEDYYPAVDKWYEISAFPSANGLSIYYKDITENKKAKAALQKAYEEKNTILESIDDGFFAVDNNSRVTYWNRKAEILLGEKREDIIGKNIHEMFASPDSKDFYNNYQKAIRENSTVHFEAFSRRSGKWFAVSAFASQSGLSVHFKDVSERVAFEAKVQESEVRYRSLVEQASDAICIADANMRFIEVNPSGCLLFGYSKKEFLELDLTDILFTEDLEINPIQFGILKTGKTASSERRVKRKDGSIFELELNSKMLEDGKILIFGRDITERKKDERKLKESNERYNLISQATNDMVWDWDLVTGKVFRNKEGWRKIFRTTQNEIGKAITDAWDSRIHPGDKQRVSLINDGIHHSTANSFEIECRVLRDDGTYAYIHDRGNIIRNEHGKPVRVIGASQDITQRKEAELQVAKSELRFRSLVQNSSDLISIFNENAYFMYSSPAMKNMLGYEPEEIIEKNVFLFIHPDDIELLKKLLKTIKTAESLDIPPFRFKNSNGEWRWLESKISDMSENPEIRGYVFNSRDVTERKLAEEEIKKLSIIAKETVNAVIVTDADEKIVWVNEAFTRITEFEAEEVIGKRPGDFLQGEETDPSVISFMREKIKAVEPFECDILNYSKSRGKYWLRIQCQPQFDEAGKLKYFFAIETDITKEKEAEEILKASEERYRYLFDNNPACISIWDIETLKILEVNNTAKYLYGFSREEFMNKTILDFSPGKYHDKLKQFAIDADRNPDFRAEQICKHYNNAGEVMYMNVSSHRIQFRGRNVILTLASDISDKIILEKELEKERLFKQQEITQAVISAQEQERQELGGELHDNINQILAGSLLYLGLAKRELKIEHQYLTETDMLINSAITEIRNLSHSLIPPSLHESELLGALKNIIEVTQKTSGLKITMQVYGFDESLVEDKLKLSIYRIVQEQFNNILKHSGAKKINMCLVQDNEKTMLSIKDDGIGFNTMQKANGVGLMNIKTRASLFNGEMSIFSSPGNGCELRVLFN